MIKVLTKKHQQVLQEMQQRIADFGIDHADIDHICETYVVDTKGQKQDTDQLNEQQILAYVEQNIGETVARNQAAKTVGGREAVIMEGVFEVRNLLNAVQDVYHPTQDGLKSLIELYHHDDQAWRYYAQQALRNFMNYHTAYLDILSQAKTTQKQDVLQAWQQFCQNHTNNLEK